MYLDVFNMFWNFVLIIVWFFLLKKNNYIEYIKVGNCKIDRKCICYCC